MLRLVLTGSPPKELICMGTAPHRADSQHERPPGLASDAEPRIPQPMPQASTRRTRLAVAVMFAALAIIVLVVLL
jgi:hypothetical protein